MKPKVPTHQQWSICYYSKHFQSSEPKLCETFDQQIVTLLFSLILIFIIYNFFIYNYNIYINKYYIPELIYFLLGWPSISCILIFNKFIFFKR